MHPHLCLANVLQGLLHVRSGLHDEVIELLADLGGGDGQLSRQAPSQLSQQLSLQHKMQCKGVLERTVVKGGIS